MSVSLEELLQTLLSAERAGVQVASASLRECRDPDLRPLLEQILAGEGESCRRLLTCMQHLGLEPNRQTGEFYARAMAIADLHERLAFIDHGQRWVIRKLQEALPDCANPMVRTELATVLRIHEQNSAAAPA
ncbi:ferritin-like domain-containing protein [Pseudomonas sp. MAP12]|uniref:Ferritin-like domain-containing protein n=1 Tax=Geopseudomonas aromaticivorans TaxID=2849492 RepID=A0ABS6MX62_9GAMM|nr:DUF6306 domain-containing protein [Pseudomonas aromaticivorans]MBV2133398.1 ferritin-like domain-containing protein [Pseudomonas aromaticivorans]